MLKRVIVLAAIAGLAGVASADEVIFKNGDRLTGEIKSSDGGVLVIASKVAGEVKVNMDQVQTFSTDKPVAMHLNDGTVINQPVVKGENGTVATAPGGAVNAAAVPVTSIKTINPPAVEPIKWKGSVSAGAILTRGNTQTDSINAAADAVRRSEDDRLTLSGLYTYGREKSDDGSRVTAENWRASGKYDYFLNTKWYLYGTTKIERDHVANLDLRVTPGVGTGYQWVESDKVNFNTEAGLTWVYEKYTDPDVTRDYLAGRFAYHYDRQLNQNVKFIHNLEVLPSLEEFGEFLLTTDAGIRARLTENFFGELKIVLDYNSQPAEGKTSTDVRYMASVGYEF